MNTDHLRLGTRGSDLARWQTDYVASRLSEVYPDLVTEIVVISTRGDQVLDTPLPLVGGKGLFTAELESGLHLGEIDLAVHSLKDLPTEDPAGLVVGAILPRANPADVLVSRNGYTLDSLPEGAVIGTSSNRRASQLLHLRPDLRMKDIRGNINTRVRKALDPAEGYDAIVLAEAGLLRLGMDEVVTQVLPFTHMLPAPGQGALAVQCRDDDVSLQRLAPIHDPLTAHAVSAERAFLAELGGGCSVPVAAFARQSGDTTMLIEGRVGAVDGSRQIAVEATFAAGDAEAARAAGKLLAKEALAQGATHLLEAVQ